MINDTIMATIKRKATFDLDFITFCSLTQKNDLLDSVMEYINRNKIHIHVHNTTVKDFSLIQILFDEKYRINKDNKLAFMRYIE